MEIKRVDNGDLTSLVTLSLKQEDFSPKVEEILSDYRKKANIPGFRKGKVPMGMIRKQYQDAVTADEVNKLLQQELDGYLQKEALDILGQPLPVMKDQIDWKAPTITFDFELGRTPEFEVSLKSRKKVTRYKIKGDAKMVEEQLQYMQKQYGKLVAQDTVAKGVEITAQWVQTEPSLESLSTFELDKLSTAAQKKITGAKVGDTLALDASKAFADAAAAQQLLKIHAEQAEGLTGDLQVEIKEVNLRELAELNQELFDKLYAPGTVTSEAELREKVEEGLQKQFEPQADQKFMNDITEFLVEQTKFDLPGDFLTRWIQSTSKEPLTDEQAAEEYEKSEKGIRYQLIEGKIIKAYELEANFEDLKAYAATLVTRQMAQYGQAAPEGEELDGIVARVLSNEEEARRLSEQMMQERMLEFYKENAPAKEKEVTFEAFVKEAYKN